MAERRALLPGCGRFEFREDSEEGPTIVGHAATFDQPYQVGYFTETIHRDAFKRTLQNSPDVRLLVDHEGQPLARTKSGTLELGTDEHGLTVRATLDPTDPDVQRLIPKLRRGDMDQMSFAFRVPNGGDTWDHSGDTPLRTIREASLAGGDVSIVTYPANENAAVSLRKQDEAAAHATYLHALIDEMKEGRSINHKKAADALHALTAAEASQAIDNVAREVADQIATPDQVREHLGYAPRAAMATADINDLPDSDFAYIEDGGTKDDEGKTTPRSLRHFPIHDAAHVRNALARLSQSPFGAKAKPAVLAAAKKFGIDVSEANSGIPTDLAQRIVRARQLRRQA